MQSGENRYGANNFKFIPGKLRADRLCIRLAYTLLGNT